MDRRFPIVPFDPQRFEPFFGTVELNATLLSGGACNSNYLVTTSDDRRLVCRIYQRGNPRQERYIARLASQLVIVPEYLWVGTGVAVLTFLEGREFVPSQALMQEAGRTIARLSSLSFDRSGQILEDGEIAAFEGWGSTYDCMTSLLRNASVQEFLRPALLEKVSKILENTRDVLRDFDQDRCLVHGDFSPNNILVSGDKITGVLDWEFSHAGTPFMDIGNLLRHLPPQWEIHLKEGLKDEGFDLPEDWRFRAHLIDLASHLEFLTSGRSEDFKRLCVGRIASFLNVYNLHESRKL